MSGYRTDELRRLAEAYIAATGTRPTTLGAQIRGDGNSPQSGNRLITQLLSGRPVISSNADLIGDWFVANWPTDVPWPLEEKRSEAAE